jgi:monodehydroascorbate reductase (NADH)
MVTNMGELEKQGLALAIQESQKEVPDSGLAVVGKPTYTWHATAGVVAAVSIAAIGYWYGRKRRRW